ncbi:MAG: anthranilate synthase component I [Nitrospira sp.]|nr:MAG: anthranilate synthase component I [Nitrospira sp.]
MGPPQYSLSFDQFQQYAEKGNLVPLYREILADYETPVSAFAKIDHGPSAYLLESIEGGEKWARYSFLGSGAPAVVYEEQGDLLLVQGARKKRIASRGNPLERLREIMESYRPVTVPGLPPFVGGAVGYLSYDMVRTFEDLPARQKDPLNLPDFAFLLTDTMLIFDNVAQKIKVVATAHVTSKGPRAIKSAYRSATERIERTIARLRRPLRRTRLRRRRKPVTFTSNMSKADFEKLYRALRVVNPSPYMYYLRIAGVELVGSSPETLVRCENGLISVRPIAGTRRRGANPDEDQQMERRLLADEKERAEHVMLVDLGRNDVGRVAKPGSVVADSLMHVERYSHVMHIVSNVTGQLDESKTSYDVLRACFPAGTVSGAPKIRAMQIIDELEPTRRGPYAGAVGYFDFSGNMDMCINIRTVVVKKHQAFIQAGAGIVADSNPEHEYEETCNKAQAMMKAVELAEQGLE